MISNVFYNPFRNESEECIKGHRKTFPFTKNSETFPRKS